MLAYYVEWHMRRKLQPILFEDEDRAAAESLRPSIVAPAPRSAVAQRKDESKRTAEGLPVQSFQSLLADLATLAKNLVQTPSPSPSEFYMLTDPTPLQGRAFELLDVRPSR